MILVGCDGSGSTAPALVAPTLIDVTPTSCPAAGGTPLILTGTGFTAEATVTVGGNPATAVQVVGETRIDCVAPAGPAGATVDVEVTTPGGTATLAAAFTYLHPEPTLTAVTPTSGPPTGGTTLTLTGSALDAGPVSVTVGGVAATSVNVASATTITCRTPPGTPGTTVAIAVTTAGGSATLWDAFTYLDMLLGTYHYTAFWGDALVPAATAEWGTRTADGMGTFPSGTIMQITDGTVDGPFSASPFPYTLDADHRIDLDSGAGEGGLSADGSVAAASTVESGISPALLFFLRREGSFSDASLNGSFHVGMFFCNAPQDGAIWGTADFDGAGEVSSDVNNNVDGTTAGPFLSTETYSVTADGTVTCGLGGQAFRGGVLMGGNLVLLAGGTADGDVSGVLVLIRKSTSASLGTLTGPYHSVMLRDNASGGAGGWTSFTGTATANGAGTLTSNGSILNTDGTITSDAGGGTLTYAITSDGTLTVTGGADPAEGGISSDGRFAFWAGGTVDGTAPQFWFLLR